MSQAPRQEMSEEAKPRLSCNLITSRASTSDCEGISELPNWSYPDRRRGLRHAVTKILYALLGLVGLIYLISFTWRTLFPALLLIFQTTTPVEAASQRQAQLARVPIDKWGWPNPCWCGETYEEAMALGCKYDHLAVDYLPPHCIDDEVVDKFIHAGPGPDGLWDYYFDVEDAYYGRNAFYDIETVEALARNGTKYYCSPEWHAGHCLYLWWKIERGVVQMEWFDSTHGSHCKEFVMESWRQITQGDKPLPTCIAGQYRHQRDPNTGLMVRPEPENDQCMEVWRPGLPHNADKK